MIEWWNNLSGIEIAFAVTAIPATIILLLQTVMLIFGLTGHGHDADAHDVSDGHDSFDAHDGIDAHDAHDVHDVHDAHLDHDAGIRIFTVRGFVAFFTIFGWSGLAVFSSGIGAALSLFIACCAGLLSMLLMAWIFKIALRLQYNGTTNIHNAIGKTATVYLRVPAARRERGKVNVMVQEQLIECDALTDDEADIAVGREVVVIGMTNQNTLLVSSKK